MLQPGSRRFASSLRVLKNRNYRVYFYGQIVSVSGSWMQAVAQSWLAYRMTHSASWLGALTFCNQMAAFLVSPFAGAVADRYDRRNILLAVMLTDFVLALLTAVLIFTGLIQVWHLLILTTLVGVLTAFDMTTRHAFAVDMVGKAELSSAIALNSVMINASRLLGPSVAGVLIEVAGEGWCFVGNALSYLPIAWTLWKMKFVRLGSVEAMSSDILSHIREGMRYAARSPVILRIIVLSSLVSFLACSYGVLLPVFAKQVLNGNAGTFAWLTGMMGTGAICSSLLFNGDNNIFRLKRALVWDLGFWGAALILLGMSRWFWLSNAAMFGVGYCMMGFFPRINNAIQQEVENSMRGRVMSLYTMSFLGTVPFGSLILGWVSDRVGAPVAAGIAGSMTMLLGGLIVVREKLKSRQESSAFGHWRSHPSKVATADGRRNEPTRSEPEQK